MILDILGSWPNVLIPPGPMPDTCQERLRSALWQLQNQPEEVGSRDIAGLVSHLLRRSAAMGQRDRIRVPRGSGWPDNERWIDAGLTIIWQNAQTVLLGPGPSWRPNWLCGPDDPPPLHEVLQETSRRDESIESRPPADPCLRDALGEVFERFTGPGQREAVRAAFFSPPGESLLVVLPTGAGKSLVGFAPAVLRWPARGLTLIVSPTVALAFDQANQIRPLLVAAGADVSIPLAWHSGLAEDDRAVVKRAIRDGRQPVLFASPEAVIDALSPALFDAAQVGMLRNLVIDEAHLVAQWGNDFRPEFQSLAGLRSELLAVCPNHARFVTTLLTATLTTESYVTLKKLFAPLRVVAALHLRPEPTYWISHAETWDQKQSRVLEACRQAPRPFLLYVTRRDDAEQWTRRLKNDGMLRVRFVHGGSTHREEVLNLWQANAIDAVVATSAFGLGMDKRDVRAVIHACVPETLDRFYQEVGRGGRDGRACLSLTVYHDRDLEDARSLNAERVITVDLGLKRWQAMFATRPTGCENQRVFSVNLNARRPDVKADNDANVGWNLQTLNLLVRSDLIKLHAARPPELERQSGETEESFANRFKNAFAEYFTTARIEILGNVHDRVTWESLVEAERRRTQRAGSDQLALMRALLSGEREFSDLFSEIYEIDADDLQLCVEAACGGCPVCRAEGINRTGYRIPRPLSPPFEPRDVDRQLRDALGISSMARLAVITYERPPVGGREQRRWRDDIVNVLLPRVVVLGVRELSVSNAWFGLPAYRRLYLHCPERYLIHQSPDQYDPAGLPFPRLTLLDWTDRPRVIPAELLCLDRPLHVLLVPDDARTPNRPDIPHRELYPSLSLETFLDRLER